MAEQAWGLGFSDAHLSTKVYGARPVYGDAFWAFRQCIFHALRLGLDAVQFGDLTQALLNRPSIAAEISHGSRRLATKKKKFYGIKGNHDAGDTAWFELDPEVGQSLHGRVTLVGGRPVYGIDACSGPELVAALAEVPPEAEVLVTHCLWRDLANGVGYVPNQIEQIPPTVKLLLTGDMHEPISRRFFHPAREGSLLVLSPGATHIRKSNEPTEHFCWTLTYDDETGEYGAKPIRLLNRPIVKFEIAMESDVTSFAETLPKELDRCRKEVAAAKTKTAKAPEWARFPEEVEKPFVFVGVQHGVRIREADLRTLVGDHGHLIVTSHPRPKSEAAETVEYEERSVDLTLETMAAEEADRLFPEDERPRARDLALRMAELSALDDAAIDAEIERWLETHSTEETEVALNDDETFGEIEQTSEDLVEEETFGGGASELDAEDW